MAEIRTTYLVDDLDQGEAAKTVEFSLDRESYEIDLSNDNAKKLRDALDPYIQHARKASRGRRRSSPRAPRRSGGNGGRSSADREQNTAIREWARKRGMEVSDRGRIPSHVLDAYHREH